MENYPEPVLRRNGCKVGWLYYKSKKEARIASAMAFKRSIEMRDQGYEFGYVVPGAIDKEGRLWRVVIP